MILRAEFRSGDTYSRYPQDIPYTCVLVVVVTFIPCFTNSISTAPAIMSRSRSAVNLFYALVGVVLCHLTGATVSAVNLDQLPYYSVTTATSWPEPVGDVFHGDIRARVEVRSHTHRQYLSLTVCTHTRFMQLVIIIFWNCAQVPHVPSNAKTIAMSYVLHTLNCQRPEGVWLSLARQTITLSHHGFVQVPGNTPAGEVRAQIFWRRRDPYPQVKGIVAQFNLTLKTGNFPTKDSRSISNRIHATQFKFCETIALGFTQPVSALASVHFSLQLEDLFSLGSFDFTQKILICIQRTPGYQPQLNLPILKASYPYVLLKPIYSVQRAQITVQLNIISCGVAISQE